MAVTENTKADDARAPRPRSFSYEELLKCGRGEMFGPGNAQLPLPPMLMVDRITQITETSNGKGEIIAEYEIRADRWFYECHFKADPVMPGCLGLDALWQMLGFFLGWLGLPGRGRALGVGEVKFSGEVKPTAKPKLLRYHIKVRRVIRRAFTLAIADGYAEIDGQQIYEAKNLRVGIFPAAQGT